MDNTENTEEQTGTKKARKRTIFRRPAMRDIKETAHSPVGAVEEAPAGAEAEARGSSQIIGEIGDKRVSEPMADNSLSEVFQRMLSESFEVLSAAAKTFEDLKTKFGAALMDELNERLQRLNKGQPVEELQGSLGSASSFLGLRVPNSVMDQMNAQIEAEGTTKSEFVRDSLSLRLRMAGLSGEALAKEIDRMLDEVMGERIAFLLSSVLIALGPETMMKFAEVAAAMLFLLACSTSEEGLNALYPATSESTKVAIAKARAKAGEFIAEMAELAEERQKREAQSASQSG